MPIDLNLQQLIDAVNADLPEVPAVERVREAQQRARSLTDIGDQLIDHFVSQARAAGAPWIQIGEALGVTKQAAQQRWVSEVYRLFTDRARNVVVLAQERTRELRHDHTGTGHLLLGILDEGNGAAAEILTGLTGSPDHIREALLSALPAGDANPPPRIPFTRRADDVLIHANAQATELGHDYVGTEHLLLGLTTVDDGTAARVLAGVGIGYEQARPAVVAWLTAYFAAHPRPARVASPQAVMDPHPSEPRS